MLVLDLLPVTEHLESNQMKKVATSVVQHESVLTEIPGISKKTID